MNPSLLGYGAAVLTELTADERRVVAVVLLGGGEGLVPRADLVGGLPGGRLGGGELVGVAARLLADEAQILAEEAAEEVARQDPERIRIETRAGLDRENPLGHLLHLDCLVLAVGHR